MFFLKGFINFLQSIHAFTDTFAIHATLHNVSVTERDIKVATGGQDVINCHMS